MTVTDYLYLPPDAEESPVTDRCVYEVDRLGTTAECGLDLPAGSDPDALFCGWHHAAVDRGDIGWEEYQTYRTHHGV